MFYIVYALVLFIASVLVHILFCRQTANPGLHAKAFILTAIIFGCLYTAGVILLSETNILDPYSWWGMSFKMTAGIIFILLVPIYLCFYVLTQLTSPSKKILAAIAERGPLSHGEILACVQKEDFIGTRLSDLCASGCVIQTNGRYKLTSEGQKIFFILNGMQMILGRNAGG